MNRLTLLYDMRAPDSGAPADTLYRAAVEQCAWADARGFSSVTLTEHHATTDGYLPSPMILGAAIAGSTEHLLIRLSHGHELSKTVQRLVRLSCEGFRAHQLQRSARRAVEKRIH